MKPAIKIRNHTDKVPTIEFHPVETSLLLAGSFDKTVALYDLRNPKENRKVWTMGSEIERVTWNTHDTNQFLVRITRRLFLLNWAQANVVFELSSVVVPTAT